MNSKKESTWNDDLNYLKYGKYYTVVNDEQYDEITDAVCSEDLKDVFHGNSGIQVSTEEFLPIVRQGNCKEVVIEPCDVNATVEDLLDDSHLN